MAPRGHGWLSSARNQRRGEVAQGEVISPAPGGLPGAQAPPGPGRRPSPAGAECCAAVSMEPGTRCLHAPERPGI